MVRLIEATTVRHPESGDVVSLPRGGNVPSWATDLIGDHLVEVDAEVDAEVEAAPRRRTRGK